MKPGQHIISYEEFDSIDDLSKNDSDLLKSAREITADAYAPYSNYRVGAAALLADGKVVTATNQENVSYPVGICAERVLLSAVASQHKNVAIETIAISYDHIGGESDHPVAPCGMCRQSLLEFESRISQPIRLLLSGQHGKVIIIPAAGSLLPFAFNKAELNRT